MKFFVFILSAILLAPFLDAQTSEAPVKAVTLNSHPALMMPLDARGLIYNAVEFIGTKDEPALTFHMVSYANSLDVVKCRAMLTVTPHNISLRSMTPACSKQEFVSDYSAIQVQTKTFGLWSAPYLYFKGSGHNDYWSFEADAAYSRIQFTRESAMALEPPLNRIIPIQDFALESLRNFSQALEHFWAMHGDMVRPGDDAAFREKAVAWRALAVKPDLPEEVKKHNTLAEAYLQEKDLKGAVEHYKAGLKAYPTWPQGWFNLALLDGELGKYGDAAREMRFFLELTPDAPQAEGAKTKILIWDDKAQKQ